MSAFILQALSAEKGFAASLNRPFEGQGALPSNVRLSNFHGSYADFMIIVRLLFSFSNASQYIILLRRVKGI
jgi:hypothetical protein